jgi:hypothetical protein
LMTDDYGMWLLLHAGGALAYCDCGWRSPCDSPEPGAVRAAAEGHAAETGHHLHAGPELAAYEPVGSWPHRCGWIHAWNDHCPVEAGPADGHMVEPLVRRVLAAGAGDVDDRLHAAGELRECVDELERQAVVGARLDGRTWSQIAEVYGHIGRREAQDRWGELITGMEKAGLLTAPLPAPPAAPARPEWAQLRGIAWCRWCGHRLAMPGGYWAHQLADEAGRVTEPAEDLDDQCPGPEPWPAQDPWTE